MPTTPAWSVQCIVLRSRAREAAILNWAEVVAAEARVVSSVRRVLKPGLHLLLWSTILPMMTTTIVLALGPVGRRIAVLSKRWGVAMHVWSTISVCDHDTCNDRLLTHADHEIAAAALPIHLYYCQKASRTVANLGVKNSGSYTAVK